jgi:hypothetical protein
MCEFAVEYNGDMEKLFQNAKKETQSLNGELIGNANQGFFTIHSPVGLFKGQYEITLNIIIVKFEKKPFFLPCGFIKNEVIKNLVYYLV